jgi:DNA-binding XRE family transcriptional regulator
MKYDLLHIQGKPHVLMPLHDYRELTSAHSPHNLPGDILDEIAAGKRSPIQILRKYHSLTQSQLAKAADLSRPYLTEIETGRKDGSIRALRAIANVFGVDVGLLTPSQDMNATNA